MFHIKKFFGKLNKRQTEEIGTLKSPTKPLYLAKEKVEELTSKRKEIEDLYPIKCNIEQEIKIKKNEIQEEEKILKVLQEIKNIQNEIIIEKEKMNIHNNEKIKLEKIKYEFQKELDELKPINEKKANFKIIYFLLILFMIISIIMFVIKMPQLGLLGGFIACIFLVTIILNKINNNIKYKKKIEEMSKQKANLENKIKLIEKEINSKNIIIKEIEVKMENNLRMKKMQIQMQYPNIKEIFEQDINENESIMEEQNYINELKLSLNKKEIEKEQILGKLETLAEVDAKLNISKEILKELLEYDEAINIAKEALETSYLEMKETITPKVSENASNVLNNITCGKYKNVKVNGENELSIEMQNRELYYSKFFK